MKVSYNWLKDYVDFSLSPEKLSEVLTDTGLEVEGLHKVEAVKGGLNGVVIGKVESCEKHPDADRLNVTTVDVGAEEKLQIVCGAPNVAAGQKVVVATVGTTLYPNPDEAFKIKKAKIRGIESFGMICAEDELGLGKSHDGIMILPDSVNVGEAASSLFNLEDDYLIEIGLTPNRADAMGHIGVARDIVAFLNVHENSDTSLKMPSIEGFGVDSNSLEIAVSVEDEDSCPRYMGTSISNVKVEASPSWLQQRLNAIGLNPINNVVDVTNYVMHELGTPLHAFDAGKLNGKVVVKNAKQGDKFTTLDGVERKLSERNLMITNGNDYLCIAGVLGGVDSGISDATTNVFLESAYFNPVSVRKTAKEHGLNTDASFRYERGVDPNMTEYALKRAALLIQEVAGGNITMNPSDTRPTKVEDHKIEFSYDRCNQLIGDELEADYIDSILNALDIQVSRARNAATLSVPAYRVDVTREADVVEEVLRIHGFNKVAIPSKLNSSITVFPKPDADRMQIGISDQLVGMGFLETMNNSLTKEAYAEAWDGKGVKADFNVKMLNPLSQDLNVMRQNLLFGQLETVAHNQNRQHPDLRLYEFGKVYHKYDSGYSENRRLILTMTGRKESENWNTTNDRVNFYTMKGCVNSLLQRLGLASLVQEKGIKNSLLEDGIQLTALKKKVAEIGWVSAKMRKQFGIKGAVFVADLDWDAILELKKTVKIKYKELPKSFAVRRDFSLLLNQAISFKEIQELALNCDRKILKEVGLFDVYEGENLDAGKKSYAVSFTFQDQEKTLQDKQVDGVMEKIRASLESKLGAELRS